MSRFRVRARTTSALGPMLRSFLLRSDAGERLRGFVLAAMDEDRVPLALRIVREVQAVSGSAERSALQGALRSLLSDDDRSLEYAVRRFRTYRRQLERHCGPLAGTRLLELGPGHTLGPGLLLYAGGAERYAAVDTDPLATRGSAFYRELRELLARRPLHGGDPGERAAREHALARFDAAVDLDGELAVFSEERVAYLTPCSASELPFEPGSFDCVLSHVAMEHFRDPGGAIQEAARVLAPGGATFHQIDLRDHRDFNDPRAFLGASEAEWARAALAPFATYTNRWRLSDFVGAFQAAFEEVELVTVDRIPLRPGERDGFDPRFRDRPLEDLEAAATFLVARRPKPSGQAGLS